MPDFSVVAVGAALGAVTRFAVGSAIGSEPIATTVINLLGCVLFGTLSVALASRPRLLAFTGTGFCGGFTTFSAFVILSLFDASPTAAAATVAAHVIGCPAAYLAGAALGRTLRPDPERIQPGQAEASPR
nr:CrcB family protein [Corynebacterium lactis]